MRNHNHWPTFIGSCRGMSSSQQALMPSLALGRDPSKGPDLIFNGAAALDSILPRYGVV